MDCTMLNAFADELSKISASNFAVSESTGAVGKGSNAITQQPFPTSGISQSAATKPAVKSTNYSIVHSESPTAAETVAPAATKAVPPPPVRT